MCTHATGTFDMFSKPAITTSVKIICSLLVVYDQWHDSYIASQVTYLVTSVD